MKHDSSSAHELLQLVEGRKIQVDSRKVQPGDIFIALKGRRSDGHYFISDAMERGAHCVIASEKGFGAALVVHDPVSVLFEAAKMVLDDSSRVRRIAITGSNGKTTTKEIVAFLLSRIGKTFRTPGNLNTDIGVPAAIVEGYNKLTEADFAVFEIATDGPGDIAALTKLLEPSVAVLLNVGTAHLGNFESETALFEEKFALFTSFAGTRTAITCYDDDRVVRRLEDLKQEKLFFGTAGGDFRIRDYKYRKAQTLLAFDTFEGTKMARLKGTWHLGHLLDLGAAYLVAQICGVDEPALHLPSFVLKNEGRFSIKMIGETTIVDDTYNSSPESVRVAAESIDRFQASGRKLAIMGSILEQGHSSCASHRRAAEFLRGFDAVILYARDEQVLAMEEVLSPAFSSSCPKAIASWLSDYVKAGDLLYFKASRAVEMEQVIAEFVEMVASDS